MSAELSYQDGGSIGGPMDIGEGYRWNVPIITYGFDDSFLNYFGTNGVAAVESAIKILNDLPPASAVNLTNYPQLSQRINFRAAASSLIDLKSMTLCLLLEQMGLAQPTRFTYCLHDFSYVNGQTNYTVLMRNFDPISLQVSPIVNGQFYDWELQMNGLPYYWYSYYFPVSTPPFIVDAIEIAQYADLGNFDSSVADFAPSGGFNYVGLYGNPGRFFTGLTRDDVGGLRYLINTNNIALEGLIPGVRGSGRNTEHYVKTAPRPGVDKITFQAQPRNKHSNRFETLVYQYEDSYVLDGIIHYQTLERRVNEPDILFTARFDGYQNISRTGTTNWINNGAAGANGPGVIQPPVVINFNAVGPNLQHFGTIYPDTNNSQQFFNQWGSFDGTTNPPVAYPIARTNADYTIFNLWLAPASEPLQLSTFVDPDGYYKKFNWGLSGKPGEVFALQTSTNLADWTTILTITNIGGNFTFVDDIYSYTPQRFYRTVQQ